MDYLERPEIKAKYDKCKYIVKLWEHNFKKEKGRQPSKLDIREADVEVKNAYKKYYQLKTTALEQSFLDVDGFNSDEERSQNIAEETLPNNSNSEINISGIDKQFDDGAWGQHLTVEHQQNKEETKSIDTQQTMAKKMFKGSKLTKRNPRKSISLSQKSKSFSENTHELLSQSNAMEEVCDKSQLDFKGLFSSVKVAAPIEHVPSQSTSIIQRVLNEKIKPLRTIDSNWLDRVISANSDIPQDLIGDNNSLHYGSDSDDVVESSEDEQLPAAKRQKFYLPKTSVSTPVITKQIVTTETQPRNIEETVENIPQSVMDQDEDIAKDNEVESPLKVTENRVEQSVPLADDIKVRKSNRKTKPEKSMAESADENEDPFHTDNDSDDPEFQIDQPETSNPLRKFNIPEELIEKARTQRKKIVEKQTKKSEKSDKKTKKSDGASRKRTKKTSKEEQLPETKEQSTYELEYSVKPRISAPRYKNLKEIIVEKLEDTSEDEVKTDKKLSRLEKKIKSGTLNDNFVSINLKKKIYCKGRKKMTFAKYKKEQWMKKKKALCGPDMDMSGCDGGVFTCFKCGDVGHFARSCPKAKGDALLPAAAVEEPEEVYTPPTLEEAAQMAKDSALSIRKSNMNVSEKEQNFNDVFADYDDDFLLAEAIKLEEHVAKLDLQQYIDNTNYVKPFHEEYIDNATDEVYKALERFGHASFRAGQERAIMRILAGKSTLLTLSTGSGKSLCYQLPAYLYSQREPCIALIISPLTSLMEDQVIGIPSFLKAACLYANQTKTQKEKVISAIQSGSLNVLLVSPEAVVEGDKGGFGSILRKLPPIAFACIDEVHCISQWSHNFRPSYLMICRVLREKMGVKTILGLTATATRATCDSIIKHLDIPDGIEGVLSDTPLPNNLILTVSREVNKKTALVELLSSDRFSTCNSIIVYCTMTKECDAIASYLRTYMRFRESDSDSKRKRSVVKASPVESYHARLEGGKRRRIQKNFMSGDTRIVVATIAFGMGINKADIRAVIHYDMPKSFESYVQEIGRAGRDGLEAHCHMFLDAEGQDEHELRRHIYSNTIDRYVIRKLLELVFLPCGCKDLCPKHEVAFPIKETVLALDIPQENISTLLCYLELHEKHYIQVLCPAYTTCKIISYGGAALIKKAAQDCPPLAMALALQPNKDGNIFEFDVISIASAIGWDSGICKHKLKNLEWNTVDGQSKRSMLSVQFDNLGFRMLAPGNLTSLQLDEALDSLYNHVVDQEKTGLLQLRAVHEAAVEVARPTHRLCLKEEMGGEQQLPLKIKIRQYFESRNPLESIPLDEEKHPIDEDQLVSDIHGLINTYRDNNFTGRAVARIFYGISSPNYPAVMWSKCYRYWRKYVGVNFHTICDIATREILKLR